MGGSSLASEVLSFVFTSPEPVAAEGKPCLSILDSTDPAQVAQAAKDFPPELSLYVVSSKSGGTAEVLAALEYFWQLSSGDGARFIAVTDPGTPLEKLAKERGFRKVFNADPNVGGRFSALTAFGLVSAALLGLDVKRLLDRATWMMDEHRHKTAARLPGVVLGAVMAESALAGRDKLTVLADAPLVAFGSWLEQLLAESSGKDGKGIVPVDREPLGDASDYGNDRLFAYLRQTGEFDEKVAELRASGQPALEIEVPETYDLGAEFYRWEMATAVACHILGVNAFNQPNVEDAKARARTVIAEYQEKGELAEGEYVPLKDGKSTLDKFLKSAQTGDYLAIAAFLPRNGEMIAVLQDLHVALRDKTKLAVTLGFGPRFLHSTGQLHKGGPNSGLFLQITADPVEDIEIPTQGMSFGTLERAQAIGDYEALQACGRRVLRVHLPGPDKVREIIELIS
jgi:glucose-6-phosphate isomerase